MGRVRRFKCSLRVGDGLHVSATSLYLGVGYGCQIERQSHCHQDSQYENNDQKLDQCKTFSVSIAKQFHWTLFSPLERRRGSSLIREIDRPPCITPTSRRYRVTQSCSTQ